MTTTRAQIVDQAVARLDPLDRSTLERIADLPNGLWYLKAKIVTTSDDDGMHDHTRPLKYAARFDMHDATVTFVKEGPLPTPDLEVAIEGQTFWVEVSKIRMGICHHNMGEDCACTDAVSKIADVVTDKRAQLPESGIGFVAIDNFDLRKERGFKHTNVQNGLLELERRAAANPDGWRRPSGVIFSAASIVGGAPADLPAFLWLNKHAEFPPTDDLVQWLLGSLTNASLFEPRTQPDETHQAVVEIEY